MKNNKSIVMGELEKKYITIKNPTFYKEGSIILCVMLFLQFLTFFFIFTLTIIESSDYAYSSEKEPILFEDSELIIATPHGRYIFWVEVAQSAVQRQQGLMGRQGMRADRGMLFDFGFLQIIHMWMKNTHIPLDMLFIDESGNIGAIAANTMPYSTTIISSPRPARAVLELNAGTISRLKIKVGDQILHQIFQSGN